MRSVSSEVWSAEHASDTTDLTSIVSIDPIYLDLDMSDRQISCVPAFERRPARGGKGPLFDQLDVSKLAARTRRIELFGQPDRRGSGTQHARGSLQPRPDHRAGQFARGSLPVSPAQPACYTRSAQLTDPSPAIADGREDDGIVQSRSRSARFEDNGMSVSTRGCCQKNRVVINA